ncbi:MAG: YceI family protein [Gallionellaceae bacterium]
MKRITLTLALISLAGSAMATPETFNLDPTHSSPRFEYNHFGYSNQQHSFDKISGKIVLDREAKTGSVDIVIEAKSVNTGYAVFNEHIQGKDFLSTEKYPSITFKSTSVKFDGAKPVSVEGKLTLKGVSKAVTLAITSFQKMPHPMLKRDAIGANAVVKIKRSEFNMGKYAPYVSDDVTITLPVEAIKE